MSNEVNPVTRQGLPGQLDLKAVFDAHKLDIMTSLNCHQPGVVQSFDTSNQTCTVELTTRRVVGSRVLDYPLLTDVPVFVQAGGAACLTMPVKAGDSCLVLFADRDIDVWFSTGNTSAPNTPRTHSLADGLALVGFRTLANPISGYSSTDTELRNGGAAVGIGGERISIRNEADNLKLLLSNFLDALISWVNTDSTTPNPGTIAALVALKLRVELFLK